MNTKRFLMAILCMTCASMAVPAEGAQLPKLTEDKKPVPRRENQFTTLAPIVEKVAPSVVTVYSKRTVRQDLQLPFLDDQLLRRFFGIPGDSPQQGPQQRQERGLGSGVIISSDGYILSNSHVVENADEVKVVLSGRQDEMIAKVVGSDPQTDIAVLKVDGAHLPAITLTDSANLRVGDVVLAVGNPFGVGQTVTMGIASAVGRGGFGIVDYEDFIQTDASINPGNSGGALVDAEGRLVGINTAILSRTGGNLGVGFAVPVNLARGVMEQIIQTGKVRRGYLGVAVQSVTPALAKELNLPDQSGALVGGVESDSPAQEAGLKEGDLITKFGDKEITDSRNLRLMASQMPPGSKVDLQFRRDGKQQTTSVTLGELPTNLVAAAPGNPRPPPDRTTLPGVTVSDITPSARQQLEMPSDLKGALITGVSPNSAAYFAGVRPGNVILEVNQEKVTDAQSAIAAINRNDDKNLLLRLWSEAGSRYVVIEPHTPAVGGTRDE
ncbi:MAG TPA: DegQ family serine endoprotease [Verrucomicrobiae bacterium]|nr:DegQ family serine endoprotease [Verrucomicrobiae bacterium]